MRVSNILLAAAFATGLTGAAAAQNHTIIMTGFAYFPTVTYVEAGDTVYFVNDSGSTQTVVSRTGVWTTGPISNQASSMVTVQAATELEFYSSNHGSSFETSTVVGSMSFEVPPLSD